MIINMNGAKAPETPSSVLQEKTVTPETLPVVIGPDAGYDGLTQVTVNPDAQLKAENIRSGKTIFGVTGTFQGSGEVTPVQTTAVRIVTGDSSADNPILLSPDTVEMEMASTNVYYPKIHCSTHGSGNSSDVSSVLKNEYVTLDFRDYKMNWSPTDYGYDLRGLLHRTTLVGENHLGDISWASYPSLASYFIYNPGSITMHGSLIVDKGPSYGYISILDFSLYGINGYDSTVSDGKGFTVDFSATKIATRRYSIQLSSCIFKIKDLETSGTSTNISLYNCTFVIGATTPPEITDSVYIDGANSKIIVPKGSLDAYKTAPVWSQYAKYMEEAA